MREIAQVLGLHPLAVEDTLKGHQRPKLDRYGDMTFLVLQPARYLDETETVEFGEVHIFVGPDFVITVRHAENPRSGARPPPARGRARRCSPRARCAVRVGDLRRRRRPVRARSWRASRTTSTRSRTSSSRATRPSPSASSGCSARSSTSSTRPRRSCDMFERLQADRDRSRPEVGGAAFRDVDDHARRVVEQVDDLPATLESALTVHATLVSRRATRRCAG